MSFAVATEGLFDGASEIAGACEGCFFTAIHDQLRDAACLRFLAEFAEYLQDFPFAGFVDEIGSAHAGVRPHAHVERTVLLEGKSTLGTIDLMRGDSDVEEDFVHFAIGGEMGMFGHLRVVRLKSMQGFAKC